MDEGLDGAPVGHVEAVDGDEGINSLVRYSLPDDLPFLIDANTGHIRTASALDYEKNNVSHNKSCLINVKKYQKITRKYLNRSISLWSPRKTERLIHVSEQLQ